ncbi:MAG TPA: condensation domain-containing protein, partial [Ktedonobacteraceae bacterium]|nr:condensation domain-containing protein [Ktedonobacteraceae bacterium]
GELQREKMRQVLAEQLNAAITNQPPMLRVQLVRLDPATHCVVLQLPHIIADVWTEHILAEDLAELYSALQQTRVPALPEIKVRYVDYAEWHQKRLDSSALQAQKDYWLELFGKELNPLDMSRAGASAAEGQSTDARVLHLSKALMTRLKQIAGDQGTTLFVVLLSAFQLLLARLTGATDVSVGTAVSGRSHPDLERIAGFFMNPLCLKSDISGNPTFTELLGRVRQTVLTALANQEYPFQQWLHALRRKHGRNDLYPYSLVLLVEEQPKDLSFAGAKAYFESLPGYGFDLNRVAGPYLSVRVAEGPDSWCAEIIPGAMDTAPIPCNLLSRWTYLLEEIVARPHNRIGDFDLVESHEHETLSHFSSGVGMDPQLIAMLREFHLSGGRGAATLTADGIISNTPEIEVADFVQLQRALAGRPINAFACHPEILENLAENGVAIRQMAPDLERVIVRATSQCNAGILSRNLGVQISAFLPLDDDADVFLWIDNFSAGVLTGQPMGSAAVFVLDEWGRLAPIGVRGRLYKGTHSDLESATVSLQWFGRWQSNGMLELETRQFDTIELDAEELEALLQ